LSHNLIVRHGPIKADNESSEYVHQRIKLN